MSVPIEVHDAVVALVEPTLDPVLTDAEIDAAILRTMGFRTWTAATTYYPDVLVTPTVPNGWAYAPLTQSQGPYWAYSDPNFTGSGIPGVSGDTEPTWLIPASSRNPAAYVQDGTITWAAAVPTNGPYDVKRAAAECLRAKARKAMNRVDSSVPGAVSARESQMYQQLMAAAAQLEPVGLY
jgi:hypothetical protein